MTELQPGDPAGNALRHLLRAEQLVAYSSTSPYRYG
jgi:hypothetical protein